MSVRPPGAMGGRTSRFRAATLVSILAATQGCAGALQDLLTPVEHIVAFDRQGVPVDPSGNCGCVDDDDSIYCQGKQRWWRAPLPFYEDLGPNEKIDATLFEEHVGNVLEGLRDSERKHVLLFIHGGLNSRSSALERAKAIQYLISQENEGLEEDGTYPIFVHWRSSLRSTYRDHLFSVRQGKYYSGAHFYRWWAPAYLLADIGRGVVRAPIVWLQSFKNALINRRRAGTMRRFREKVIQLRDESEETFWSHDHECRTESAEGVCEDDPRATYDKPCDPAPWRRLRRGASLAVTIPTTKLVLTPLVDAAGSSAWKIMLRRTETMMTDEWYFRRGYLREDASPIAPFAYFIEELAKELGKDDYRLTLVGHSMGAIIIDNVVRGYGDELPIDHIVYMGAANELAEYQESVIPYLERPEGDAADVFHLNLGVRSELGQLTPAGDLIARGSLLTWLDDFLTEPVTSLERRAGAARNLVRVAGLPGQEGLEDRIHTKIYSDCSENRTTDPRKHGHFSSKFKFWDPHCWEPSSGSDEACFDKAGWVKRAAEQLSQDSAGSGS